MSSGVPTIHTAFQDSFSEEVWASTYKDHNDTSIDDTLYRVAKAAASVEQTEELRTEWTEKFYDMLSEFKCTAGGRIYANAGTEWKGTTLMNCYVSPRVKSDMDSLDGILTHLRNQAQTLKSEGGWGENFSYIRPRGAFIHGIGVETPGAVKYMEWFDKGSEIITSGSGKKSANKKAKGKIRKGAMMGVLDVWHPDIIEFITAKQQAGRLTKFNISVNCTDEFMQRVVDILKLQASVDKDVPEQEILDKVAELDKWDLRFPDTTFKKYKAEWDGNIKNWEAKGYPTIIHNTVSVLWLWNLIMESTYNRAEPGVLFLDRANYFAPLAYKETIQATNPSMPAGTLVHTKSAIIPIEELEGKGFEVKSLDGEWAPAECRLSGINEELLEIKFGANRTVKSTKEHRWPVYDQRMGRIYKVDAKDLKPGDLIPLNRNEQIGVYGDMSLTHDEGFLVGYLLGDGWFSRKGTNEFNVGITFGAHEREMAEKVLSIVNSLKQEPSTLCERQQTGEIYLQFSSKTLTTLMQERYKLVPGVKDIPKSVWEGNDNFIKGFVDGLLSADGSVSIDKNNLKITFTTSRKSFALNFAKLLSFAGIPCNVWNTSTDTVSFPNGKDYDKTYDRWDVAIQGRAILKFVEVFDITHPQKQEKLLEATKLAFNKRYHRSMDYAEVVSVKPAGTAKVWDISVHHNQHVFPTEWCYTGNCGEQTLAPGGVCNLGSLNLTQFINKDCTGFDLKKIKKYTQYMVRFLDDINDLSDAPLPEYVYSMKNKRRVGVGILGWGSVLFMLKIRFGSDEAAALREQIMSTIAREAYMASIDIAVEKGMFSLCEPAKHAEGPFIKNLNLPEEYMNKLRITGIRNSSLLSVQPTGNTSILANVVSGGLEPIFMPEYIRTVIVNTMPEHIASVTPKWFEGEWFETEMFKKAKEGDEEILRGTDPNGVVYKIDKNRGLTKEVLCEDYGVRFLKKSGEWNPTADWAVTTVNMSVKDHVNDLIGFARWVDSAMSKTINVPNDYPFDKFKNIYLDAYTSGFVKGVTTYRSGTMTTVLSAKEEKNADQSDEEIIIDDVKLPDSAPAVMKTLRAEGRKYYVTVVYHENNANRPFALFVKSNHHESNTTTSDAVDLLLKLARKKKIPKKHIEDVEAKIASDNNANKVARSISLLLRHGVLIKNIVAALDRVEDVFVGSFIFQIKKFLSAYIKDGEKVEDEKCMECGSTSVVFREGCKVCVSCGSSKCG